MWAAQMKKTVERGLITGFHPTTNKPYQIDLGDADKELEALRIMHGAATVAPSGNLKDAVAEYCQEKVDAGELDHRDGVGAAVQLHIFSRSSAIRR